MIIYRITNIINGKVYIGRTTKTLKKRWQKRVWRAENEKHPNISILNAIAKYGKDCFIIETIKECKDLKDLLNSEKKAIKEHKENGYILYNLTKGGDGSIGLKHTIETKRKMQ